MKYTKEERKQRERWKRKAFLLQATLSGVVAWIRIPYNLLHGISLSQCIENEKYDLWNLGLYYRDIRI